jgi:hypothetical protein
MIDGDLGKKLHAERSGVGLPSEVDGTSPAGLPLLAVLARIALAVAAREATREKEAALPSRTEAAALAALPPAPPKERARPVETPGRVA